MKRVTGREAVTLLAEAKAGKRKFTVSDERYLLRQADLFRDWLMDNAHLTKEDAKRVLKELFQRDLRLIESASDLLPEPLGDEPDDFRISPATMQRIETGVDPREDPSVPTRSREVYERALTLITSIEDKLDGRELTPPEKKHLWDIKLRINAMRFREPRKLEYQHWAALFNRLNGLLGINKRAPEPPRPGQEPETFEEIPMEEALIRELELELGPPPDEQEGLSQ
jgi:hypothetical protein